MKKGIGIWCFNKSKSLVHQAQILQKKKEKVKLFLHVYLRFI